MKSSYFKNKTVFTAGKYTARTYAKWNGKKYPNLTIDQVPQKVGHTHMEHALQCSVIERRKNDMIILNDIKSIRMAKYNLISQNKLLVLRIDAFTINIYTLDMQPSTGESKLATMAIDIFWRSHQYFGHFLWPNNTCQRRQHMALNLMYKAI